VVRNVPRPVCLIRASEIVGHGLADGIGKRWSAQVEALPGLSSLSLPNLRLGSQRIRIDFELACFFRAGNWIREGSMLITTVGVCGLCTFSTTLRHVKAVSVRYQTTKILTSKWQGK